MKTDRNAISEQCRKILDEEHLKLLSIAYFVLGGFQLLFCFIPLIYAAIGFMMIGLGASMEAKPGEPSIAIFGGFFLFIAAIVFLVITTLAALKICAGFSISRRRYRVFCFIVAAISCLNFPFGTALGVFTFMVLSRPTVAAMFHEQRTRIPETTSNDS